MDGVLFYPRRNKYLLSAISEGSHMFFHDIYEWLSIVHNTSTMEIKDRLLHLKAVSLLEDIGDNVHGVIVHDLYYDFAKLEVKRGDLDSRHWIWYDGEYPTDLALHPSCQCWQNLKRISVNNEVGDFRNVFTPGDIAEQV